MKPGFIISGLCSLLVLAACSSSVKLTSNAGGKVEIDGQANEWTGHWEMPEDTRYVISSFHDEEYVYVALKSRDAAIIRQVSMQGFDLWLDAGGGRSRDFGVQFSGAASLYPPGTMRRESGGRRDLQARPGEVLSGRMPLTPLNQALTVSDQQPCVAAGAYQDGEWFCEFRIARALLNAGNPGFDRLGFGLVTREPEFGPRRGRPAPAMSPPTDDDFGGSRPGGMQGGFSSPPGAGRFSFEPVEIWISIDLNT